MKINPIYMLFFKPNSLQWTTIIKQIFCSIKGYLPIFSTGRLHPDVQPLALLYTIFARKGTPFVYLLLTNSAPFTMPVFNMNQ